MEMTIAPVFALDIFAQGDPVLVTLTRFVGIAILKIVLFSKDCI